MKSWHRWGDGSEESPDRTKLAFAVGAGLGLLVLGWMMFARADEEKLSSSGFSVGGAGRSATAYSAERRAQTGLAFVSHSDAAPPSSVRVDGAPGAGGAAAPADGAAAPAGAAAAASAPAQAAGASGSPAAAGAATPAAPPPPDPKELAAAGLPTDPAGLKRLGSDSGLLTGAISRLLEHPRILRALLNNKMVVDALMDREDSKRNCSDAGALQAGLSSPGAAAYESKMMPLVSAALSHPDAVAAMAGSEMSTRLMACPSVQSLAQNPAGLAAIVAANPQTVAMVSDPRVAQGLATSIQGAALLGGVQSSMSGGLQSSSGGSSPP